MTIWNAADKSATISLSGGNLTATSSTAVSQSVRSSTSKSSGKVFFELTLSTLTNDISVGIANATMALNVGGGLGGDANGLGFYAVSPAQSAWINGTQLYGGGTYTSSSAGAVVSVALDISNKLVWISTAVMRATSTPWNNSGTANPATGTNGQSISTLAAGPYYICFNDDLGGAVAVLNVGASAYNQSIPTGFSSWDVQGSTLTSTGAASTALVGGGLGKGVLTSTGAATLALVGSSSSPSSSLTIAGHASVAFAGTSTGPGAMVLTTTGRGSAGFVGGYTGTSVYGVGGIVTNTYALAQTLFFLADATIVSGSSAPTLTIAQGHGTTAHGTLAQFPDSLATTTATIRASDLGYRTSAAADGDPVPYPPLIAEAFALTRAFNISPLDNSIGAAWGTLTLRNDGGQFNSIVSSWNNAGRAVTIRYGLKRLETARQILIDPPLASLGTVLTGLQGPWFLSETDLQIPLRDASVYLQNPLQTSQYTGSGSYGGSASLAGQPLPMARGGTVTNPIKNVSPILIDTANLIYQYNDAPGSIVTLYEGAYATFTFQADTTNLYTGSTTAGKYRTDNSRGLFQLGSSPVNAITADVTGQFAVAGVVTNPVLITRSLLSEALLLPSANLALSTFTAAAAAYPYEGGVYFPSNASPDGLTAVSQVLGSLGAKLLPSRSGALSVMVLRAPAGTPVTTFSPLNAISVVPQPLPSVIDPPVYRVRVAYQHNYTLQVTGFDGGATLAQQQFAAASDRYGSAVSGAVQSTFIRPNDLAPIPGCLTRLADASAVATDLLALWGTRRRVYAVTIPVQLGLQRDLGDVVSLVWPMDNLSGGQLGVIVGEAFTSTAATITFNVLV